MIDHALPFASVENDFLRVDYLTTTGPRLIGLYVKGREGNLLAETPQVHWPTPHGEYYLRGGHRLWTAPEDPFYTCPEEEINLWAEENRVILKSNIDASGLEKKLTFCLEANQVELTHQVTWHGKEPIELAPWAITQLRLEGLAILPQSSVDGLQPNRQLVFWPYSRVNDPRLEVHDDLVLIYGRASEQAFKIGINNRLGWAAYLWANTLLVKRFRVENTPTYPDLGCTTEVYVKDACLELETLGPLKILNPNETVTYKETWEIMVGEYGLDLESVRNISQQLSLT